MSPTFHYHWYNNPDIWFSTPVFVVQAICVAGILAVFLWKAWKDSK